jgi:hypothetical protein
MKKIVRLTESDLVKLVKRVIMEQQTQGIDRQTIEGCVNNITGQLTSQGTQLSPNSYNAVIDSCGKLANLAVNLDPKAVSNSAQPANIREAFSACSKALNSQFMAIKFVACTQGKQY